MTFRNTLMIQEWGETFAAKISHLFRGENYIVMYLVFYRNRVGERQLSCNCYIKSQDMILVNHIIISKDFKHFVLAQSWWMRCSLQLTRFRTQWKHVYIIYSGILYILSWLPSILLIFGVHFNPSFINLLILWVSDRALSGQAPRTVHFCRVDRTWVPQKIPNVRATSGGQPLRGEWSGEWVEAARFWGNLRCNNRW